MIVVTGATGQLGRLVIEALLERTNAAQIIAAVRNPETAGDLAEKGIQVRQADYNQPETLTTAFAGAEKILLISSSEVGQRVAQHQAVVTAAEQAGVKQIAYTSILHCDRNPMGLADEHKETEALLAKSTLDTVIMRNGWYTENYTMSIPVVRELGTLYGCAGKGRFASASRRDFATAAAVILTSEDQADKVYELAGSSSFSLAEYAAELSQQTGESIKFNNLSEAEYKEGLIQAGLPEGFAALLANAEAGASEGWLYDESNQLETLIGRKTQPLAENIAAALKA